MSDSTRAPTTSNHLPTTFLKRLLLLEEEGLGVGLDVEAHVTDLREGSDHRDVVLPHFSLHTLSITNQRPSGGHHGPTGRRALAAARVPYMDGVWVQCALKEYNQLNKTIAGTCAKYHP